MSFARHWFKFIPSAEYQYITEARVFYLPPPHQHNAIRRYSRCHCARQYEHRATAIPRHYTMHWVRHTLILSRLYGRHRWRLPSYWAEQISTLPSAPVSSLTRNATLSHLFQQSAVSDYRIRSRWSNWVWVDLLHQALPTTNDVGFTPNFTSPQPHWLPAAG